MFGRIMVVTGMLATAGLGLAAAQGYRGAASGDALRLHVLTALVTVLVFILAHAWVLFYLVGAVRVIEETARGGGREDVVEPALTRFGRRTLPPLVGALAASLALFLAGVGVYAHQVPASIHGDLFWLVVVLELWAAWGEWRALVASERAVAALQAA